MFTPQQAKVIALRKKYTQAQVARILNVSQPNITKIERTIKKKIQDAIFLLKAAEQNELIFIKRFKPTPLDNAFFVLPYIQGLYEVTGVSAQFLLTEYYKLSNEIEIRTLNPSFSKLWGIKIIKEEPGPLVYIKNGICLASQERILADCLRRNDLAGLKSSIAMLLNFKIDFTLLSNLLDRSLKKKLNLIIQALKIILKEYELEKNYDFPLTSRGEDVSSLLLSITRKIVDDFAPFLEEQS
ncbi:MAG: hypothetical protein ACTSRS_14960 [Candidatus Helarchaeota archaeon]